MADDDMPTVGDFKYQTTRLLRDGFVRVSYDILDENVLGQLFPTQNERGAENRKSPGRPKLDPERNERLCKLVAESLARNRQSQNAAVKWVARKERIKPKTLLNIWLAQKKTRLGPL